MNQKEFIGILTGALIMLASLLFLPNFSDPNYIITYLSTLLWVIGGFIAAFISRENKSGVLKGFLAGLISGIIIFILFIPSIAFDIIDLSASAILLIVMVGLFGITGGLISNLVNEWKTMKKWKWIINFAFTLSLLVFVLFFFIPTQSNIYGLILFMTSSMLLVGLGLFKVALKLIKIVDKNDGEEINQF